MDKTSQQLGVVSTGAPADLGRTLILLGHGSHLNSDSAQAVRRHAIEARALGLFGEVLEGSWKEEPSLRQLLRLARYRDVTVVPLFVSEGYFTGTVIPRELGLEWRGPVPPEGVSEMVEGRQVHYTRPYGVHPEMSRVILARAAEVCADWNPPETALVVLGHGTGRDAQSQEAIEAAAARLRESGQLAEVLALYLDQEPQVSDWATLTTAPDVVIVPFFASEGWHTQETIPHDLGLSGTVTEFASAPHGPRRVFYSRPVGTHPAVTDVVLRLLADSAKQPPTATDADWQAAGEALAQAAVTGLSVGELSLTPLADGTFDLRHRDDAGRLDLKVIPPTDLSAHTGRSDAGTHRPIRTQRSLPHGWHSVVEAGQLRAALHAVYPAILEEAHLWEAGLLPVIPWPATAARQSGIYASVKRASPAEVARACKQTCSACLRTPLWAGEDLTATFLQGNAGGLPCPEACTLLVAHVRELHSGEPAHA